MQTIILSVRPPWARLLVEGKKTVEIRKRDLPGDGGPVRALIYETRSNFGSGEIIGEVVFGSGRLLAAQVTVPTETILRRAHITQAQAREYAQCCNFEAVLWAWLVVSSTAKEHPWGHAPAKRAPQSWRWVKDGDEP